MSAERKRIMKKLVSVLKKENTPARDNIFNRRSQKIWQENLPAVILYPRTEEISENSQAPRQLKRELFLVVECLAEGRTDEEAADNVEDLMESVEEILALYESAQGKTPGGDCLFSDMVLDSVEFEEEEEAEKPIVTGRLIYNVEYYEYRPRDASEQRLKAFAKAHVDWDVGTADDPDPEATDDLDIPQE